MNNFGVYITPKQAKEKYGDSRSLKELTALANRKDKACCNCDEKQWKYGGCGMCFSCTTGEADASEAKELVP